VLTLAALQLVVLVAGLSASVATGLVGFAALGAAWMFLGVRVSRFVLGDRRFDEEARRVVLKHRMAGASENAVPAEVAAAVASLAEHDRMALAASAGAAAALFLGLLGRIWPATGIWWFGVALLVVVGLLVRLWAWRSVWARARAIVEAWRPEGGRA
jgi:hypothetical protein